MSITEAATLEEIHSDEEETQTTEIAEVESGEHAKEEEKEDDDPKQKQNRSEKKARKVMQKLGMKLVSDINRVTVRKSKNILFVIQDPDVYKSNASDTYVIFGEAKIEDLSAVKQNQAAQQFKAPEEAPKLNEIELEDEEDVDAEDLDDADISMVMDQANVSRGKAIK
eukprot:223872_1